VNDFALCGGLACMPMKQHTCATFELSFMNLFGCFIDAPSGRHEFARTYACIHTVTPSFNNPIGAL
jgi:hypothetical protein